MIDLEAECKLNPETGYPPGYKPGWWRCSECGTYWHDRTQRGNPDVAWNVDPECGPCGWPSMERVSSLRGRLVMAWKALTGHLG